MFENKGKMIYVHFNENFFKYYYTDNIYLNIDNVEFKLNELADFIKTQTTNALLETTYIYSLGYVLDDDLANAIKNASSIRFEMIRRSNNKRREWELSNSTINDLKNYYNCFVKYYTPIEQRLIEEERARNEEYERNLKKFDNNFRNSKWFDSKEAVKASENSEIHLEKDDYLAYETTLNADKFIAVFYFNNDRLFKGAYLYEGKFVNENNFYSKYNELKNILTKKYGEPKKVIKHRNRSLYDGIEEIGMAIQTGEYKEYTLWETKNSTILLSIEGENFDSKISIVYDTKDPILKKEANETIEKKSTEGF